MKKSAPHHQQDKSVSDLLAEIGVYHTTSTWVNCRSLYNTDDVFIDAMDAQTAAYFYHCAKAAA